MGLFAHDGVMECKGMYGSHGAEGGGKRGDNGGGCLHPEGLRSENVSEYSAARDRHDQYASPTLPEIVWTLKGKAYRHGIHEEADETEEIGRTGGKESLGGMSAVS